jgi:hypothetical protein
MASDWVPVLGGLFGAITGGAISLIISLGAEAWQRRLYGPKLELHCEARDPRAPVDWLDESNKNIGEVIYVRMRVRNVKPRIAKSCRAYLTKVERLKDGKTWENTNFGEGIQLAWAGQGTGHGFDAISLPKGVDQFIDIVAVGKLLPFAPPSESANSLLFLGDDRNTPKKPVQRVHTSQSPVINQYSLVA